MPRRRSTPPPQFAPADDVFRSALAGDLRGVERALAAGGQVDGVDDEGRSALWVALIADHDAIVTALLAAGANVNLPLPILRDHPTRLYESLPRGFKPYAPRTTLLHEAAAHGAARSIPLLMAAFAVDVYNSQGTTPLHVACARGASDAVKVLLALGASTSARDGWNRTPLQVTDGAAAEVFETLLASGANANDPEASLPLLAERAPSMSRASLAAVLAAGARPEEHRGAVLSLIHVARVHPEGQRGELNGKVSVLLDAGFSLEEAAVDGPHRGVSALALAAQFFEVGAVLTMLARVPRPPIAGPAGSQALSPAIQQAFFHAVGCNVLVGSSEPAPEKLVGAPPSAAPDHGVLYPQSAVTPERRAARLKIVAALLDHGADANAVPTAYPPALHAAAWAGLVELVELLLERGARIDLCDPFGRSALWYAAESGQPTVVQSLLSAGADRSIRTKTRERLARTLPSLGALTAVREEALGKTAVEVAACPPFHPFTLNHRAIVGILRDRVEGESGQEGAAPPPSNHTSAMTGSGLEPLMPAEVSLSAGTKVRHLRFGVGRVTQLEGSGDARKLTVAFEQAGIKTLLARYVEVAET